MSALSIYTFFKRNKVLLLVLVLGAFGATAWFASRIKLEEDINKFIPKDKKIDEINFALNNIKIKDKLVLNIYNTDTSSAETTNMMLFADALADTLNAIHANGYIDDLTYKISDDLVTRLYGTFYNSLPIFLEERDYATIDGFLQPDSLQNILYNDYNTLLSPSSIVFSRFLKQDPLSLTSLALKKMQHLKFDENFDVNDGYIMTLDKKNLMMFISSSVPSTNHGKTKAFFESLDGVIQSLNARFEGKVTAEYYGAAAVALGNANQIKHDSIFTSVIALVCIVLVLGLFFRRLVVILYILLPVVFGALFSLTILYFIKDEISAIALGAGSIILGIAINYPLHFFTHYKHERSVEKVISDLALPMLIGCTTTVGAFLSLKFAKSQALHDFGLFAGFSLIGAALFSIIVLPHLLKLRKEKDTAATPSAVKSFPERVVTYRLDKNKPILIATLILTVVFAFTARNVTFESDMLKINYQSDALNKAQQHLDEINNYSLRSVYIIAKGANMEEALKVNERATAQLNELKDRKLISKFSTVSNLLISDSLQRTRIARWNTYWTAEKKDSLQQRLIRFGNKYKFKEDAFAPFYAFLQTDFKPLTRPEADTITRLVVNDWVTEKENISTIVSIAKVETENKKVVYDAFDSDNAIVVFDKQYMSSQFVEIISSDFNLILLISSLLVIGFMLLSHGRIELVFINFLPMFIGWIWILGIMGLFGLKFNIINIIISTFIFGVGDDYSIFMLDGLSQQYKYGKRTLDSYKTSISLSAITTIIGIGVLIFAEHPALKSIATITIIGITTVLFISFFVQPLVYNFLILNRKKRSLLPYTAINLFLTAFGFAFFIVGSIFLTIAGFILFTIFPAPRKQRKLIFHYLLMYVCRFMIYLFVNVRKNIINPRNEQFETPAIIICNHQSHLDLALTLMLHPKIIVFTNDWVWNSIFYGRIVKMADFYPASQGYEAAIDKVKALMADGYSALIFPEGTRSVTGDIQRFHKGAFYLAEQLNADILPLLLHGAGDCVTKGDFHFKEGRLTLKYLPRILPGDKSLGATYQDRAKNTRHLMSREYELLRQEQETVDYYRARLIKNYIYKGPVLEWYCRIKVGMENNYKLFESYLPKQGKIVDVGCGYGFLPLMLSFMSKDREVLGIDYDSEKIDIAANCISRSHKVNFVCADVTGYDYENADAFVISDVLHYLTEEQQTALIATCAGKLNENGVMIIRDADADKTRRHRGTRYTEFFSINSGFNKAKNKTLHFTSATLIRNALNNFPNLEYEVIDNTTVTSNIIFIVRFKNRRS